MEINNTINFDEIEIPKTNWFFQTPILNGI